MRWTDLPIHFIDFEGNTSSGVLEFGIVTLRAGAVAQARGRLCRAIGRIAPEDQAVHGLSEDVVRACEPFSAEFETFATLRESGPLAAHFAHVENSLLKSVWPYPRVSPDFSRAGAHVSEWGPWIDTGRLATELYPKIGSAQLHELVGAFGLQAQLDARAAGFCPPDRCHYHAAGYDALAAALVLLEMLKPPQFAEVTVPWLLQMSTGNPQKRADLQQGQLF